jgi:hypothetical protein
MIRRLRICLVLLLSAMLGYRCSNAAMKGVVTGFVFDRDASTIRPIRGIPGAATQADAVLLAKKLAVVAISPRQDFALAVEGASHDLIAITGLGNSVSVRRIAPGTRAVDMLRLSPRGNAALLYRRGANSVQFISGLPGAPRVWNEIEIGHLPGSVGALAVSDDALLALATVNQQDSAALYLIDRAGNTRPVFSSRRLSAVSFVSATHDAVVIDDADSKVVWIHDAGSTAAAVPLADSEDGVSRPVGVEASPDGRRVFVANGRPGSVLEIDRRTHINTLHPCACSPTGLTALNDNLMFRLTESSGAALWIFDASAGQSGIAFVPPPARAQDGESR